MNENAKRKCRDVFCRRKFLSATGTSAALLLSAAGPAASAGKTPQPVEKVLLFGQVPHKYLNQWEITSDFDVVAEKLGIRIEVVPKDALRARYEGLSEQQRGEAAALAKRLVDEAQQDGRARPDDAELEAAVRYFMAMHSIVAERGASAATLLCGSFPPGKGPGPCAALTLLADHGVPAGCQGDIDAVLTMALFKRAAGVVSFMGGAFAQGSRLRVGHCVLPRTMKGPEASQPYYLARYHGTQSGVTIHTDLGAGEPITVARLTRDLKRLIIAEGTLAESIDPQRGCRNALLIEMADVRKLMSVVRGGQYHLVVACGHHLAKMRQLADQAGIEVFAAG
jgi:L-fucose isomerase-like protein